MDANQIIENLGGTAAVARLCHVKQPSVSQWRRNGIPQARLQFLMLLRPEAFRAVGRSAEDSVAQAAAE